MSGTFSQKTVQKMHPLHLWLEGDRKKDLTKLGS